MQAAIQHHIDEDRMLIRPVGGWVIDEARRLDGKLRDLFRSLTDGHPRQLILDLSDLEEMDTAGAYLLARTERLIVDAGGRVEWAGADASRVALLERVRDALAAEDKPLRPPATSLLEDIGATVISVGADARR